MDFARRVASLEEEHTPKAGARSRPDLFADSFPEQVAAAKDPSSLKVDFCTRRASKSFTWGLEAVDDSFDWPTGNYLFLGLVRQEAKRIFWKDVLKAINAKHGIGMRFNESELTATMPNGATIYIGAADANEDEMRKLLGQKYRKVCVDEAQDWKHTDLEQLVFHTLKPACADFHGSISLTGTAGLISTGFFRSITPASVQEGLRRGSPLKLNGWSVHCWDTSRNTAKMPDGRTMAEHWAQEIAELKAMKPGIEQTAWFRRNYLGEWVVDEDALVYRFTPERNSFKQLPAHGRGKWSYVLGCDLGFADATAFVVCAYHPHDRTLYIVEAQAESGMDFTSVANRAKALDRKYGFDVWIVDGANKQGVEEMRRRQDCPWKAADKRGKNEFIELMNAEFLTGGVKASEDCAPLLEEYRTLIWDQKKLATGIREEDARCSNHAADGALYSWRHCFPYLSEALPADLPRPGTHEWHEARRAEAEQQSDAIRERLEDELRERQRARAEETEHNQWLGVQ